MKLLEHIVLVQFFLYGSEDLETGLNTAFLGPNGTGKSAILDAIQVVMLAADGNRTHFNAAGEGKKRSRTLRDYCLGASVPGMAEYARLSANTYIDLVFRDTETGIPFTAGVSLSARVEDTQAEVHALYILPGVALTPKHHLQTEGQKETVMPWREFRHIAADLCRLEGHGAPVITLEKETFIRQLLIDHLAGPGDKPNSKSLRAAFARSLKLGEEIDDLNDTLRQHLIEPMPSRVKAFRDRLDDVRKLRDLISTLKERIGRASEAVDRYAAVKRERTTEANLIVLKHTFEIEQQGAALDAAEAEVEQLAEEIALGSLEKGRAFTELQNAKAERDQAIAELNTNPEYVNQAALAQTLKHLEDTQQRKHQELHLQFAAMLAALASCAPALQDPAHAELLGQARHQVSMLLQMQEKSQTPPVTLVQAALRSLSDVHDVIHYEVTKAVLEQRQAAARHQDALTSSERAIQGLTELNYNTIRLMGVLKNAGVDVEPVCDMVTVSDPDWQPAIESWLGRHVEALLVPAAQELVAIQVYRSNAASGIYGVKLALPSRVRQWTATGSERYAAQLIQGETIEAVRYLQGELGRTALVETNEQLRVGNNVISKEGMASSGGGIERRRLPGISQLRIGRNDAHARRQHAAKHVQDTAAQLRMANETISRLDACRKKISHFSDATILQHAIENQLNEFIRTANETRIQQTAFESTLTDSLAALTERKISADSRQKNAENAVDAWTAELGRLTEKLCNRQSRIQSLKELLEQKSLCERQSRQHILYGADEVERLRSKLEARHGENWPDKLDDMENSLKRAGESAAKAHREAWVSFSGYAATYNLQNHSVTNEDWIGACEFIFKERRRLGDLELVEQEQKAEEAYEAAVKVFRTDVAQALLSGFDQLDEQIKTLTTVLKAAPPFTNNERYEFRYKVVDEHRSLYDFIHRIRTYGSSEEDLFGGAGETPEEFRQLVDGDISSTLLDETSPLNDHRRFFSYDVEVFQHEASVGMLSKRFGPASGGEHRTPLYLIFGAALAAAYGKSKGRTSGGGIMLLDEAFDKMDPQNIRAAVQYLNALGLQLIMAGPETDQAKLSSFLNIYYDMSRYGSKTVQLKKNVVFDKTRELLRSDNFHAHPDLLQQEIARLTEAEHGPH
jgi:uncharacterized protein YPO0396